MTIKHYFFSHDMFQYSRYASKHCFNGTISAHSNAHMRFPVRLKHRVRLTPQYWNTRLGLCNFAHMQLHKCKPLGRPRRWRMGLDDTTVKEYRAIKR